MSSRIAALLRGTIQHTMAWTFCAVYVPLIILITLLTAGRFSDTLGLRMIRFWGRQMLRFSWVRVEVEPSPQWHERRARVITFNHASTLDMFVVASVLPPGSVPVVKREIVLIPFIGWAIYFLDFILLDRRNRERAIASLTAAGERMRREQRTVLIAPEGTRTGTRAVGPFKMGPFRLAESAGAPVVPLVIDGAAELWPRSQLSCKPGVVRVRLLDEIPAEVVARDPAAAAEHARALYLQSLGVEPDAQDAALPSAA